jgi:DNA-directed RNA polymerase subunit RPC12/RpoP
MKKNYKIKLVKCSTCGKAFYIKTESRGSFKLKCPYCEKEVRVKINESSKNGSL